jgi:hypothetical protein
MSFAVNANGQQRRASGAVSKSSLQSAPLTQGDISCRGAATAPSPPPAVLSPAIGRSEPMMTAAVISHGRHQSSSTTPSMAARDGSKPDAPLGMHPSLEAMISAPGYRSRSALWEREQGSAAAAWVAACAAHALRPARRAAQRGDRNPPTPLYGEPFPRPPPCLSISGHQPAVMATVVPSAPDAAAGRCRRLTLGAGCTGPGPRR